MTKLISIPSIEVEWHQLQMSHQHFRIRSRQARQRLMVSIDTYGLLVPIVVVQRPERDPCWIVIDGHLRIDATRALGQDTIRATVWELSTAEALIHAYQIHKVRPSDALEEAHLLYELMVTHDYSQVQLAKRLGKSEAWVSQRLQLITSLPNFVRQAIDHGHLTLWSACRVLIPFARANAQDAEKFIRYLMTHSHSSREIDTFYQHYLQSNKKTRQQMVELPPLFFKSLALSKPNKMHKQWMQYSPEVIWENKLKQINLVLDELMSIMPAVFYPQQNKQEREQLESLLQPVSIKLAALQQSLHRRIYAQTASSTDCASLTSSWQEQARDQSNFKFIT